MKDEIYNLKILNINSEINKRLEKRTILIFIFSLFFIWISNFNLNPNSLFYIFSYSFILWGFLIYWFIYKIIDNNKLLKRKNIILKELYIYKKENEI